jgi:hypothetical protein
MPQIPQLLCSSPCAANVLRPPGKLTIAPYSSLQGAIDTKKRVEEDDQEALQQIMEAGLDSGVHPLERPEVPAHIKV